MPIVRLVALTFVAAGLALVAGWGPERGQAESGVSGAEGRESFSGPDLPAFLKEPPKAMDKLRLERSWISSSVAQVWNHGDDVSELSAGWRTRLRRAGFKRAGRQTSSHRVTDSLSSSRRSSFAPGRRPRRCRRFP